MICVTVVRFGCGKQVVHIVNYPSIGEKLNKIMSIQGANVQKMAFLLDLMADAPYIPATSVRKWSGMMEVYYGF